MAATMPAIRMMLRGALPDLQAHVVLGEGLRRALPEAEAAYLAACDAIGRPDLREKGIPNTTTEAEVLLDDILNDRHLALWKRTTTGKLKTGKDVITPFKKIYPPIEALLTYRKICKQLETYGEGWALFVNPDTGRIHSTFNVSGALTGRATSKHPNLQKLPKRQPIEGLASYRSLIVAAEGNVFVDADYDQMEFASPPRSRATWRCWRSSIATTESARHAPGDRGRHARKATRRREDEERGWGKTVNFAQIYGQKPNGLINRMLVLCDQGHQRGGGGGLAAQVASEISAIRNLERSSDFKCESRGRSRSARVAFSSTPGASPTTTTSTRRSTCRSKAPAPTSAWYALALIDERLRAAGIKGGIILWIYDEFLLEVAEADAPLAAKILVDSMIEAYVQFLPNGPVKGLVAAKIGRNWAATKG